jgi:hypothetical protein
VGIINRRNAVTGWAVWKFAPRLVKWKVRKQPPPTPPAKKRPRKGVLALASAAALGLAGFLRLRKRSQD